MPVNAPSPTHVSMTKHMTTHTVNSLKNSNTAFLPNFSYGERSDFIFFRIAFEP